MPLQSEKTFTLSSLNTSYTNVISQTCQCLRNHTVINADGYKCLVQSGEAKIGLLHLSNRYNTNVIYKTGECLRNHTVVNADGYKCLVQSGEAKIGLLHLSNRYYIFTDNGLRKLRIDFTSRNVMKYSDTIESDMRYI